MNSFAINAVFRWNLPYQKINELQKNRIFRAKLGPKRGKMGLTRGLREMLRKPFLCMKSGRLQAVEILTLFTAPMKAGTVDGKAFF